MSRTKNANLEALISPLTRVATRFGHRPAYEVLLRRGGTAGVTYARDIAVYSTENLHDRHAETVHRLVVACGRKNVVLIEDVETWEAMRRFLFTAGFGFDAAAPPEPIAVDALTDLPAHA